MFYRTSEKGIGSACFGEFNDVLRRANAQRQSFVLNFRCDTFHHSKFKIMLVFYHWIDMVLECLNAGQKKSENIMEYHWFSEVLWHFYVNILDIS